MRKSPDQVCRLFLGMILTGLSLNCNAGSVNVHAYGMVPAPTSTADDFHVEVTITQPFVVGAPINFHNGPWGTDGLFTPSTTGFSVNWSGPAFTGGGPYDFQFDFTVDQPFTGVAYWTLSGTPVQNTPPVVFTFESTPIPEPSSLLLLTLAAGLLLAQRQCRSVTRSA